MSRDVNTRELVAEATPLAETLVRLGSQSTKSLLVWLLALRIAEKIDVDLYLSHHPEMTEDLTADRANIETLVAGMQVQERGPAAEFNLSVNVLGKDDLQ